MGDERGASPGPGEHAEKAGASVISAAGMLGHLPRNVLSVNTLN